MRRPQVRRGEDCEGWTEGESVVEGVAAERPGSVGRMSEQRRRPAEILRENVSGDMPEWGTPRQNTGGRPRFWPVPPVHRMWSKRRDELSYVPDSGGDFFDPEDDVVLAALDRLQPVAAYSDQMRNVDDRERVCAAHFQPVSRRQGFQSLARLERRKRAFQSRQIQLGDGHGRDMR